MKDRPWSDTFFAYLKIGVCVALHLGAVARCEAQLFTEVTDLDLSSLWVAAIAAGDYDSDGKMDLVACGRNATSAIVCDLWRNTGAGFTNTHAGLPPVYNGSVAWGDYNNDGRLDILIAGMTETNEITEVWRSTPEGFANANVA